MQSADLFCCSCNALLITRGEGCLIIAGGGIKDHHLQMGQIHGRLTKKLKKNFKKYFMVATLLHVKRACFLCFPIIPKESFSPSWTKIASVFSLMWKWNCRMAAKPLQVLSVYSSTLVHSTQDTLDEEFEYWRYKLIFCLSSTQPPHPPTFLTSNCKLISFTVSLATLAERLRRFHQETECGNGVIIYCMAKVLIFTGMHCSLAPLFHVYFSRSHQKVHN